MIGAFLSLSTTVNRQREQLFIRPCPVRDLVHDAPPVAELRPSTAYPRTIACSIPTVRNLQMKATSASNANGPIQRSSQEL
eukprot:6053809-Prymnesium_polylepis.1